jgi:hypothetical protein
MNEVFRHPLFWMFAGQILVAPSLIVLAQHFLVPRTGDWRQQVLQVLVAVIGLLVVIFVPFLLAGYPPVPDTAIDKEAMNWGFIVGIVLSLPMRSFALKRLRALHSR